MNFANHLDFAARARPGTLALSDPTRVVTFAELAGETNAFANALEDLGIAAGDRVALYMPNSIAFVTAYFGAMKRGAIPFPINMRFGGQEIGYVLDDGGASVVVTHGKFEDVIAQLDTDPVDHLIVADGSRGHDYADLIANADPEYTVHPRKQDELAELLYTSGTTGRPKGVKHTHNNLTTNAFALIRYLEFGQDTVGVTACPCFHVSGLNVTVTPLVVAAAENHLLPKWEPEMTLQTMQNGGVTFSMLIPTMALDLLEHGTGGYDLSALETVAFGGAPMPTERISDFEEATGATLLEGFGMTETTPAAAINTPNQEVYTPGSIGPPMREVVDVRIEDPDTAKEVSVGEQGELLWHGDTVTPGYYNLPEKNEEAFVQREGKRWLRSGDIGHMDEHGHLFIDDRIDDMIISGGENVYPREVEDVIYKLDDVVEVGVIGTPDERLGERVTAIVVRTNDSVSAEAVEDICRDRLADYKIPRKIHFIEDLPKTATRKIDKVALRTQFA